MSTQILPKNISMRVPHSGRLANLEFDFKHGMKPSLTEKIQGYKRVSQNNTHYSTLWSDYEHKIFAFESRNRLYSPKTINTSSSIRAAMLSIADNIPDIDIPPSFWERGQNEHCAIVPLPFSQFHNYATGQLFGFAVFIPPSVTNKERNAIDRVFEQLQDIRIGSDFSYRIHPVDACEKRTTLQIDNWSRPSKVWQSVTPYIFERFVKKPSELSKKQRVEESCRHIGLPAPSYIELSPFSTLPGVPGSSSFHTRRKPDDPKLPFCHVTLEFDKPVEGPLVMGKQRHFGMGLFVPCNRRGK